MLSCTVPAGIRKVADSYKDVFFEKSKNYNAMCALLSMYIFGLTGLCELVRYCPWSQSVSTLQRHVQEFNGNRFMRRLRIKVLNKLKDEMAAEPERFCFAIDDTCNEKYGKKIFAQGRWGKSNGSIYNGQKIMILVLIDKKKGYAIPVSFAFCEKKDCSTYVSGHNLVLKLLEEVYAVGYPNLMVVMDAWFGSNALLTQLNDRGIKYVVQAKENRKVRQSPNPNVSYDEWRHVFKKKIRYGVRISRTEKQKKAPKTKYIAEALVYIKGYKYQLKAVAAYNHSNNKDYYAVYLSNDLKASCGFLFEVSRRRWLIEELFRNIKQNLSFGKLSCKGRKGADMSVCLPFALITSIQLFPNEWSQEDVDRQTAGTRVEIVRSTVAERGIHFLLQNKNTILTNKLKARRHVTRIHKKPLDSVAEGGVVKNVA